MKLSYKKLSIYSHLHHYLSKNICDFFSHCYFDILTKKKTEKAFVLEPVRRGRTSSGFFLAKFVGTGQYFR